MFPKLFSVRIINELEGVVAIRVFYAKPNETLPIYEEFQVKINHAHLFEKIEEVNELQSNSTVSPPLQPSSSSASSTDNQMNDEEAEKEESRYYIDKIQVFLGEGKEERMWTFDSPFLTQDSQKETFVLIRDRKGEVELRHLRDKDLRTKYDYSQVFGNSADDILGF
ncbi:predicted protein [Naegleria gruberi]|uniref:Predicted protein n=1 Tax=Naegleria gruberi TaxID=5762 RepID=D2VHU2_NAEGR|nr:uncharacterized protein NAEGRDRAFT_68447 [Naegleria gruberi]EFC43735.1 predicted protein [Naegleria gruberi]|eukprot:XP_002676479.1 predicted protein [Naegleria gruberi strain NEG-M]